MSDLPPLPGTIMPNDALEQARNELPIFMELRKNIKVLQAKLAEAQNLAFSNAIERNDALAKRAYLQERHDKLASALDLEEKARKDSQDEVARLREELSKPWVTLKLSEVGMPYDIMTTTEGAFRWMRDQIQARDQRLTLLEGLLREVIAEIRPTHAWGYWHNEAAFVFREIAPRIDAALEPSHTLG